MPSTVITVDAKDPKDRNETIKNYSHQNPRRLFVTFLFMMGVSLNASAQSIQKYFGYYGGDINNPPGNAIDEMKDHINLYSIITWSADTSASGRTASENYVLSELAKAKSAHIHAMIPGFPFVLSLQGGNIPACWAISEDASQSWSHFAQEMVDQGYLVPGNPDKSTVAAVYVVDEPEGSCLADQNGAPHPALQNAVNAIRSNSLTSNLPLASIFTTNYKNAAQDMKLLDWVGFDSYGDSDSEWYARYSDFKNYAQGRKLILVPGAQSGPGCVKQDSPTRFIQTMNSDSQAAWLAPFTWFSPAGCTGTRDIPSLRATYTSEGLTIKANGCASSTLANEFCQGSSPIDPIIIDYILN